MIPFPFQAGQLGFEGSVIDLSALSPAFTGANMTLSNGNRSVQKDAGAAAWRTSLTDRSNSTGLRYFEFLIDGSVVATPYIIVGIATAAAPLTNFIGSDTTGYGYYRETGTKVYNGGVTAYGASYAQGDRIGCAVNVTTGKIWFAKNNTWQNSGNPAAGTGEAFTITGGAYKAGISLNTGSSSPPDKGTIASVASQLVYAPPSGFIPWNS